MNKGMQKVKTEEISLGNVSEIIVIGDPGCTGFDDRAKRILGGIFEKKADAFIILGDMSARGSVDELSQLISFSNMTARAPVFTLCGNHDLPGYREMFGRSTYLLIMDNFAFLLVDNVTDWDHFAKEDLAFVKQKLDKYPDKRFIILFHIPPPTDLAAKHMKDPKWNELKAVLDVHKGRIECLMCGHIHAFRDHVVDGYRVFITGGGGAKLKDLERDTVKSHHAVKIKMGVSGPVGFDIIRIQEAKVPDPV